MVYQKVIHVFFLGTLYSWIDIHRTRSGENMEDYSNFPSYRKRKPTAEKLYNTIVTPKNQIW